MESNPILSEFKAKIVEFETLEVQVDEIPPSTVVGAIELSSGNFFC